eukprot:7388936-Prymnesium_polylepis.2
MSLIGGRDAATNPCRDEGAEGEARCALAPPSLAGLARRRHSARGSSLLPAEARGSGGRRALSSLLRSSEAPGLYELVADGRCCRQR